MNESGSLRGLDKLNAFLTQKDETGESNLERIRANQKILRRISSTAKNKSVEASEKAFSDGIVVENGKLIGFGIHIFNEDIYPLQSFEIYLRDCGLSGTLDLGECEDMVFLDVYRNRIGRIVTGTMPAMRIFGVQDNLIEKLDVSGLPACQGIDAGKNRLTALDVSGNAELVELYVNDNALTAIDLSHNPKLKYFYCHNNGLTELDTRRNPLLRHLNACNNPLKRIFSLAPQREGGLPLKLTAGEGGSVGLRFNPVYNAQWKETGEWEQCYFAYPEPGFRFSAWYDETGAAVNENAEWKDVYGTSRVLKAEFSRM